MEEELYKKIRNFISELCGISESEILESSGLERDLGVYGDDAMELLLAYSEKFNVDVSNFMAADYFNSEGDIITRALIRLFAKDKGQKKNLTVAHLVKGVAFGRLDEDVINT